MVKSAPIADLIFMMLHTTRSISAMKHARVMLITFHTEKAAVCFAFTQKSSHQKKIMKICMGHQENNR